MGIRSVNVRSEETRGIQGPDEISVVVAERRGVFLHAPRHVHHAEIQVILGIGLAVRSVVICDGFELLVLLGKVNTPDARKAGQWSHFKPVDFVIHDHGALMGGARDIQVSRAHRSIAGHVDFDRCRLLARRGNAGDFDSRAKIDVGRGERSRQIDAEDLYGSVHG